MQETSISIQPIVITDPNKPVVQVTIAGQLDESNVDAIAQQVYSAIDQCADGISFLFDFQLLEYLNSKSIGYLLDFYRRITEKGGKMVIARAPENVLDILEIVGVTRVLEIHFTIDEAKLALSS